jgi:MFS family permease
MAPIPLDTSKTKYLWTIVVYHRRVYGLCALMCLAAFQFGFDYAIINTLQASPSFLRVFGYADPTLPGGYGIDSTTQQLLSSLLTVGSFTAGLVTGYLGNKIGRRMSLMLGCVLTFIALAIMVGVLNINAIYVARVIMGSSDLKLILILGFGNSLLTSFAILWISECAPAVLRGILLSQYQIFSALGGLVSLIINNYMSPMASKVGFRVPIALLLIIPFLLFLALLWLPDTPRQLLYKGKVEDARKALLRLNGATIATPEWMDKQVSEIQAALELELNMAVTTRFTELFCGTDLRRTLITFGAALSLIASGVIFLAAYSVYFFSIAGSTEPFIDSIIILCIGLAAGGCSYYITRTFGRRTIMIWGDIGAGLCMMSVGIAYTVAPTNPAALKALVGFVAIFNFMYPPV